MSGSNRKTHPIRYGDPGTEKALSNLVDQYGRSIPKGHILCSITDCPGWIVHTSKYCNRHLEITRRYGHPKATKLNFAKYCDHVIYARSGLYLLKKTPEGRETYREAVSLIERKLKDSYSKLPRNPYAHLEWNSQEMEAFYYCNLAEHGVDPAFILERFISVHAAHTQGFHKFYSPKHLRFTYSNALLSTAPKPLLWSARKKEWTNRVRIPQLALETIGTVGMDRLAPIETFFARNGAAIRKEVAKRKEWVEFKRKNYGYKSAYKRYRYANGDIAWRGRRVTQEGLTFDPLSGGKVRIGIDPETLQKEAERSVGTSRNQKKSKVITRKTVGNQ